MRFELESYGRIGGESVRTGGVQPDFAGDTVHFARPGVVETYEMKSAGVEQSFTFATLPQGSGDLVVRLAVATDLEPTVAGRRSETLQFTSPELGSVHIGKVTGIDADGVRAEGWMRYQGGSLELGLPAEFVDNAALPLVLDPLIGVTSSVGQYGHFPDVAYDETNGVYLVAWQGRTGYLTTSPNGIFCRRVSNSGAFVGGITTLATSTAVGRPKVTNINSQDTFIVTWEDAGTIRLASVRANNGAVVTQTTAGVGAVGDPAIGGVSSISGNTAILYWNFQGLHLHANTVQVSGTGALTVSPWWVPPYASPASGPPSITRAGGDWRRQFLTWEVFVPATSSRRLRGTVVNFQGTALTDTVTLASAPSNAAFNAAIDGDGANWVLAHQNATGTSTVRGQIRVRPVRVRTSAATTTIVLGTPVTLSSPADGQDPKVAWMGSSVLVAWSRFVGTTGNPHFSERFRSQIASIDPFTGAVCESPAGLAQYFDPDTSWQAGESVAAPALGSTMSGTTNQSRTWASQALVAWSFADHGYLGHYDTMDVRLRRFRADDGAIISLGGACASGGSAYSTCAVVGNPSLVHRLHDSAPLTPAYLVLGANAINIPCGPCMFVANPTVVVGVGATNAFGEAQLTTAIPNNPAFLNATLFEQWWLLGPSTPAGCGIFNVDLSNALRITIQ